MAHPHQTHGISECLCYNIKAIRRVLFHVFTYKFYPEGSKGGIGLGCERVMYYRMCPVILSLHYWQRAPLSLNLTHLHYLLVKEYICVFYFSARIILHPVCGNPNHLGLLSAVVNPPQLEIQVSTCSELCVFESVSDSSSVLRLQTLLYHTRGLGERH